MGKGKGGKRDKRIVPNAPAVEKRARVPAQPDPTRSGPSWRFALLDHEGPFGWNNLTERQTTQKIVERLAKFEGMTWTQIMQGTGSHNVALDQLSSDAQRRLRAISLDDVDQLFSLRVEGRPRVWGILDASVLSIIWWDPEHLVCPSNKKNT
ncbi:MAG: hypothetical protein KDC98_10725 [Planctomycetes bacterium]|nr:hypothetical protein [Planctomycetota bacterium]